MSNKSVEVEDKERRIKTQKNSFISIASLEI